MCTCISRIMAVKQELDLSKHMLLRPRARSILTLVLCKSVEQYVLAGMMSGWLRSSSRKVSEQDRIHPLYLVVWIPIKIIGQLLRKL